MGSCNICLREAELVSIKSEWTNPFNGEKEMHDVMVCQQCKKMYEEGFDDINK